MGANCGLRVGTLRGIVSTNYSHFLSNESVGRVSILLPLLWQETRNHWRTLKQTHGNKRVK